VLVRKLDKRDITESGPRKLGAGMRHRISIAVIVVNLNGRGCLERCLKAVKDQSSPPDRVILVDNGSKDGSVETARQIFPSIETISLSSNVGFAAANNIGVQAARGADWVALVNNDAFCDPNWLESLRAAIRERPDYACFGSRVVSDDDASILDGAGDIYHVSGFAWRRYYRKKSAEVGRRPLEAFAASATAVAYRRNVFLEVGGFDEDFFCYFEDVDFGFRLRLAGYRTLYLPSAVVRHVGSNTRGEKSPFCLYYGHRNLVWAFFKNMPALLVLLYLPQHLLFNLLSLVWYAFRGHARILVRAKADALKGLPAILKKRAEVQQKRRVCLLQLRRFMARGVLLPYLRKKRFSYAGVFSRTDEI
jgi:GT2 family glycosyltransferase